jgi:hypothetical protein
MQNSTLKESARSSRNFVQRLPTRQHRSVRRRELYKQQNETDMPLPPSALAIPPSAYHLWECYRPIDISPGTFKFYLECNEKRVFSIWIGHSLFEESSDEGDLGQIYPECGLESTIVELLADYIESSEDTKEVDNLVALLHAMIDRAASYVIKNAGTK